VSGGTAATVRYAKKRGKSYLVVDLSKGGDPQEVNNWISEWNIKTLNVAGPRESKVPGIHDRAFDFLIKVFDRTD
ncbi:MAG: hypothetical protein HY787_18770, partial [Deltaproteobacteria bacterium]|nr:hypothetical protein [Deltaproteobacteria bacterium]